VPLDGMVTSIGGL